MHICKYLISVPYPIMFRPILYIYFILLFEYSGKGGTYSAPPPLGWIKVPFLSFLDMFVLIPTLLFSDIKVCAIFMYACKRNSWIEFEPFNCLGFRALSFNQKQFFMFEKKTFFWNLFWKSDSLKKTQPLDYVHFHIILITIQNCLIYENKF